MAKSNAARAKRVEESKPGVARKLTALRGDANAMALDSLIHERARLAIVSALAVNPRLSFNELKELLDTTDGNLSVHARKLEEAGYITCAKSFEDRKPRTEYRLAATGRRALERYLEHMESLIKVARDQ